jgi:hypothetical protein
MLIVRRVGAAVLVIAAVWVWFNLGPAEQPDHRSERLVINAEDDLNNENTEGRHNRQSLMAGQVWSILSCCRSSWISTPSYAQRDDRPAGMLGLCVLGIALVAGTTRGSIGEPRFDTVPVGPPDPADPPAPTY